MSRKLGNLAEERAIEFLLNRSFEIVERNFYCRYGEIDIIAKRDNILHFIEVKSGKGEPIERITKSKISKLIKSLNLYIDREKLDIDYSLDAIVIKEEDIEFIDSITI